ncbi:30S ribosome-binding factor RbfA [soil metagenome]|nr:30S ribosome-binding factor RbfA [Chthoniobacterales bacterium]
MKHRLLRVNELVKRELSRIVTRDLDFDGLLVTINQVNVTPDLRSGHVFVSVLGKGSPAGVIQKLEANRTILQAEMAKTVVLKYTPHLVFHLDDSIERGTRVFKILEEIAPPAEPDEH